MARFSEGEYVRATVDMAIGLLTEVKRSERGVVRVVSEGLLGGDSYQVKFDSGVEDWIKGSHLEPA